MTQEQKNDLEGLLAVISDDETTRAGVKDWFQKYEADGYNVNYLLTLLTELSRSVTSERLQENAYILSRNLMMRPVRMKESTQPWYARCLNQRNKKRKLRQS